MIIVEDIYIKVAGYTDEEMKIENVLNAFLHRKGCSCGNQLLWQSCTGLIL